MVNCGKSAKDMVVEIRDEDGAVLPEQAIGKVWTTGPSIMSGYFRDQEATDACLVDGWLDTGDMGYMSGGYLYRSEERRVGKECVSTCRYRWSPDHQKKKIKDTQKP